MAAQPASFTARPKRPARIRALRGLTVAIVVILLVQGWFGDFVTVFVAPSTGVTPPEVTPAGLLHALAKLPTPLFPLWHASQGLLLVLLAITVLILAFAWSHSRGVRAWSVVGLLATLSAALGGFLFVKSGFADGGSSMQMGGSYLGALASYFLVLYFSK